MTAPSPDYENPPVIEVVCGVSFAPLENFKAIHPGLFWERLSGDFPHIEEHPPLSIAVEQPAPTLPVPPMVAFTDTPPMPRVWFLDKTGNGIIQLQRDAFLHNWRKLSPGDRYPRFRSVVADFKKHLETYLAFVEELSLGRLVPLQYELTYVNHITASPLWSPGHPVSPLFPDFMWRKPDRFLPDYEATNLRTSFALPDGQGRLHVSIQNALRRSDSEQLLVLEMKARGIGKEQALENMWAWFGLAHTWIVRGFADLTSEEAQVQLWGRKA